jgi:hypothetical protein
MMPPVAARNPAILPINVVIEPYALRISVAEGEIQTASAISHVHRLRVIFRHVNEIRIDRKDLDLVAVHDHLLLRSALQGSRALGLLPQFLDGVHNVRLLIQEGNAQRLRPIELVVHHRQDRGIVQHGLDGRFHVLRVDQGFGGVGVGLQPACGKRDLHRIRGCRQYLRYEGIGIERDGRDQ